MNTHYEVIYNSNTGMRFMNLVSSELQPTEVLVKPRYVGICGTDLFLVKAFAEDLRLGHEWIGEITDIGSQVQKFKIGDTVTGTGHFSCGDCFDCNRGKSNLCETSVHFSSHKMGALRSEFAAPQTQITKVDSALNKGLVLHEVFGVGEQAYELIKNHIRDLQPQKILIFGAGPIGVVIGLVLKSYGHSVLLVEKIAERIKRAQSLDLPCISIGEALLRPEYKSQFKVMVDATNDYSGSDGAFQSLSHFAKKEFVALIVGKYIQPKTLTPLYSTKAGQFIWMQGISNEVLHQSVAKWTSKLSDLSDQIISHTFPAEQTDKAIAVALDKTQSLKVVIEIL